MQVAVRGCVGERLTAHADAVAEEVAGVRDERDDTALYVGVRREVRVLEAERACQAKGHAKRHGHEEGEEEDAHAVEERGEVDVLAVELGERPARVLGDERLRVLSRRKGSDRWR